MTSFRILLASLLLPLSGFAGEFHYVKRPTRAETKAASTAAINESFGLNRFKQSPWKFLGPFDNQQGLGIAKVYPPEIAVDLNAQYDGAFGKPIRWQDGSRFRDGERNDLLIFDVNDFTLCYFYRTIESDRDQDAVMSVGSDDCIAIWLNAVKVHEYRGTRGVVLDEDLVPVRLKKGVNRLLLKISNYASGYGFSYRLSQLDAAGLAQLQEALRKLDEQIDLDFPNPETDYYRIETIRIPLDIVLEIGGLASLPDGRLAVCTRRGEVWTWHPQTEHWQRFATGLHEALGICALSSNAFIVAQRPELTRIKDTDGDGVADLYETMTDSFGLSGNYHEFHFGPVRDREGNFFGTLNVAWEGMGYSRVPLRGWAYELTAGGEFIPYALGLRSPSGIGISPEGDIFITDSQGDWWGTSPLLHLQKSRFYGHPAGLVWARGYEWPKSPHEIPPDTLKPMRTLPAAWFVYGPLSRAPSEPVWDASGGKFGPFNGQMFVTEQSQSALLRVALERVGGEFQGAVFPFRKGFESGPVRAVFAADGSLYVGQTDRGWGAVGGKPFGLQRLVWNGRVPMEIQTMKLTTNGFDLTFTQPVDAGSAANRSAYSLHHFYYHYFYHYGSSQIDSTPVPVEEVKISPDRRTVSLLVATLAPEKIYELHITGLKGEDGTELLHPEAYYTLNRLLPR